MKWLWVMTRSFLVITYVVSFRGPEGFLLDIGSLCEFNSNFWGFVTLPLYGKVKEKSSSRCRLMYLVEKKSSGINVKDYVLRLLAQQLKAG